MTINITEALESTPGQRHVFRDGHASATPFRVFFCSPGCFVRTKKKKKRREKPTRIVHHEYQCSRLIKKSTCGNSHARTVNNYSTCFEQCDMNLMKWSRRFILLSNIAKRNANEPRATRTRGAFTALYLGIHYGSGPARMAAFIQRRFKSIYVLSIFKDTAQIPGYVQWEYGTVA